MIKITKFSDNCALLSSTILNIFDKNQKSVIALPTGKTPIDLYHNLITQTKAKTVNWNSLIIFILDVMYPQKVKDPLSYDAFIHKHLLNNINLPLNNFYILDSETKDPENECANYEKNINDAGGLDLAILGVGKNGHIAFNEPGSSFESVTRKVKLTDQTRITNGGIDKIPEYGLTMGIKTIMSAKKIFLLAKGKSKTEIVKNAVQGPISTDCPASILQTHPDCTFFLDEEAASQL